VKIGSAVREKKGQDWTVKNVTKGEIWGELAVVNVINHTNFGNDRSGEYKVTEG